MLRNAPCTYSFDDFTLEPVYSEVPSRKTPNTSSKLSNDFDLSIPIISSCMNTVTDIEMMEFMTVNGGTSILHRYMSIEDQLQRCNYLFSRGINNFFVAIGASDDYLEKAKRLIDFGVKGICIDVANGYTKSCETACFEVKKLNRNITLMAGNVCNYDGAMLLANAGADLIRVGVGNGAACKTRVVSGHGIPQLSALEECVRVKDNYQNVKIIGDGGIRNSGDLVKCLAIGADVAMIGNLLAGTDQSPGEVLTNYDGRKYKIYAGMASEEGRLQWFGAEKASYIPEGVSMKVSYKGDASKVISELIGGLRVGMTFSNALTLSELRKNAVWRRVTQSGYIEGTPHGKERSL